MNSQAAAICYHLPAGRLRLLLALPFVFVGLFTVLWFIPGGRGAAIWLILENRPVELATFVLLAVAGLGGIGLSRKLKAAGYETLITLFYVFFSVALLIIAMEEIAWGQKFLNFKTPDALATRNMQGEVTLHNMPFSQGKTEVLRLAFALGGMVGMSMCYMTRFQALATPPVLLPALILIALISAADLYGDYNTNRFENFLNRLSEVIEMLIGLIAFLYVWLNGRRLFPPLPERTAIHGATR